MAAQGNDGAAVELAVTDPKLKSLPNVCKLISNVKPYSTRSTVKVVAEMAIYQGMEPQNDVTLRLFS